MNTRPIDAAAGTRRVGTGKRAWRHPARQSGVAAVEVALLSLIFFMLVLGIIEVSRALYMFNTLHESTRRAAAAAALTSHRDLNALDRIRQDAVFRTGAGGLAFGAPITDRNIRIDYLALVRTGASAPVLTPIPLGSLPTCPRANRLICLANPNAGNCIRFVRVRVCAHQGSGECDAVPYQSMAPLIPMPIRLPKATTITMVESFGSQPEGTPCL